MAKFNWKRLEDDLRGEIAAVLSGRVSGAMGTVDAFAQVLVNVLMTALKDKNEAVLIAFTDNIMALANTNQVQLVDADAIRAAVDAAPLELQEGQTEADVRQQLLTYNLAKRWEPVGAAVMAVGRIALKVVLTAE